MRNLIIILLLSFFGHSHAQKDASDYFNAAALLYVNKNDDACKNKIKDGLYNFFIWLDLNKIRINLFTGDGCRCKIYGEGQPN